MTEENKKTIRENVLRTLKEGEIKMKPRSHFIFKTALSLLGLVIVFLSLLYLASFIIFALQRNGGWFVPAFGSRGWLEFFFALPWLLVICCIIFIAGLEILVRKYSFAYKRSVLGSVCAIIFLALLGGFALARTPFHPRFFRFADEHHIPFAGHFYHQFGDAEFNDINPGRIVDVTNRGFLLQKRNGEMVTVYITPDTRLPFGSGFLNGDYVVVIGGRASDTISAFGVRKITTWGE